MGSSPTEALILMGYMFQDLLDFTEKRRLQVSILSIIGHTILDEFEMFLE